jgi:hypothetical protein
MTRCMHAIEMNAHLNVRLCGSSDAGERMQLALPPWQQSMTTESWKHANLSPSYCRYLAK